jgi:hypothetical protein
VSVGVNFNLVCRFDFDRVCFRQGLSASVYGSLHSLSRERSCHRPLRWHALECAVN